ncbi:NusG domain II-containing protein [Jeotgalibaca sp. MA1X17-3]|uniref:NusG domain II-containing protein n=1 Tax=Jeotgalibaca sp. MA1X17-3 TaxID=2908211 RepID=UPI001F2A408E|nr:NusG domain II-containing protein [Jeotgalibaca sp. MA1X17-3]UJF16587.1 NusG domain II-containing protein [Jeotgalibaca sp. MA1X17-3]
MRSFPINGEEVDRFLLTGNDEHKLITYYPAPGIYNIIEIDGESIRDKEDNSPQQIAVRTGWIQSTGQTSFNIPHRFLIEIVSENREESGIDILVK